MVTENADEPAGSTVHLAAAYGQTGDVDAGLRVVTEALTVVDNTAQRVWKAELYRRKGELLLKADCGARITA